MLEPVLNNCPFCKYEATIQAIEEGRTWQIKCTKCPAEMRGIREDEPRHQHYDQRITLLQDWSRRHGN